MITPILLHVGRDYTGCEYQKAVIMGGPINHLSWNLPMGWGSSSVFSTVLGQTLVCFFSLLLGQCLVQ